VTANGWEATNSKPPTPIIIFGQSEKQSVYHQVNLFITFFPGRCTALIAFFEPQQTVQICLLKKPFSPAKAACFDFSSFNFTL
jgi:hypothetical protein